VLTVLTCLGTNRALDVAANGEGVVLRGPATSREGTGEVLGGHRGDDGEVDPCATMSLLTCYRTSRNFHFPFRAVCSLSGTQPEFSLGRLHPHVEKDILSLFVASESLQSWHVLRRQPRGG
jgi:hypothetical protein